MNRKKISLLLCAAIMIGALGGCGSADTGSADSTAAESVTAAESATSDAENAEEETSDTEEAEEVAWNYRMEELASVSGENQIYGEMYLPVEESETYPTVILSHGFGGSVSNLQEYAQMFADAGYAAYVFDFCGGGMRSQSDGDMTEMSVLTEASDLNAVIDQISELDYVDPENLFLMGESQGAYVSAYVAAQRSDDIQALILYYPAFMLADRVISELEEDEVEEDYETREFLGSTVGRVYDDALLNIDIYAEIGGYTGDVLIVHGTSDKLVPMEYSERALEIYESAELYQVEGGNHGFFDEYRIDAAEHTIAYLDEHQSVPYSIEVLDLSNGDAMIYGEIYLPAEEKETYPTVIVSHGYGGYGNAVAHNAEYLASNGYATVIFDFRGGGKQSRSDGDTSEMSVLTEASDLEAVIEQVKALPYVDSENFFLLGESQGGFVSSYVAAQHADEVKALILYYPAFVLQDNEYANNPDPENIPDTQEFMGMTIGRIYYDDATSFDIFDVIGNYTGDVLIQHGDADTIAPIEYSERALEVYENAELITIPGANHGWGGGEMSRDEVLEIVDGNTLEFLNNHLS